MENIQSETLAPSNQKNRSLIYFVGRIFQIYLILAVPILLTLLSVRFVMSSVFLNFEYNRPSFPEDVYGFTREDRLNYAPIALEYLLTDAGIILLQDLSFSDGSPLYNERELEHMVDVKKLTQIAFKVLWIGMAIAVIIGFAAVMQKELRRFLRLGLLQGSILTLGIIGVIVISAVMAWDTFFTSFHQTFFESGTWRFAYSDTLIRLFPEQFWFDAALTIGIFTTTLAFIIMSMISRWWLWLKRY